jgi:3-oxoacyl-[acyl-carrier protein] reductase
MLNGRVVLVTGSTRGLGRGLIEKLLDLGAKTTVTGREQATVDAAVHELSARFGSDRILGYAGDLTEPPAIASLVSRTLDAFGGIDGAVANLGSGSGLPGWAVGEQEWRRMMALNFDAARRLVEATLPHLRTERGASLVLISSIASLRVSGAPLTYTVAKAALNAYAKALSFECAPMGVRVNVVSPGNVFTEGGVWDKKQQQNAEGVSRMLEREVPMKRFADPGEVAEVVTFLLSEKSSFMTGAQVVVDGGQTRRIL